jgi:hypothetical protein
MSASAINSTIWSSKKALLLIFLIYGFVAHLLFIQRTKSDSNWTNLIHDSGIYYAYLPATFIKKDPLWNFMNTENANNPEKGIQYWAFPTEEGKWIPKMSMGKAMMDLPFFLAADAYVKITKKHERTGFSKPYKYAILFSTLFYALLGFVMLRLVLLRFFDDKIVAWVLLLLSLATNLYHYSTHETGMTHPHNFFLLSAAIYLSLNWTKEKYLWRSLLFGVVCGLIVLVRPINIILLLALPFFSSYFQNKEHNFNVFIEGLRGFLVNRRFLLAILSAFVILLPQLLFWKAQSGSWLHYSYNDEGFFFSNPSIIKGLFSFRKGWLIYAPVMLFSLVGLYFVFRKNVWLGTAISLTFLIFVYLTFSWWCWWYGGGFGARTMIDIYPFMAFGLAAAIAFIYQQKSWIKAGFFGMLFFFIGLNMFQTYQYKLSLLHWDSMTFKAYKGIFLKTRFMDGYADMISEPDYEKQKKTGTEN